MANPYVLTEIYFIEIPFSPSDFSKKSPLLKKAGHNNYLSAIMWCICNISWFSTSTTQFKESF